MRPNSYVRPRLVVKEYARSPMLEANEVGAGVDGVTVLDLVFANSYHALFGLTSGDNVTPTKGISLANGTT